MLPGKLIPIKTYTSPEWAWGDQEELNAARIPNYLGYQSHNDPDRDVWYELKVPEEEVQAALRVLGIEEQTLPPPAPEDDAVICCPQCGGVHIEPLPPYLLFALLAVGAVTGFSLFQGGLRYGIVAALAGSLFYGWLTLRVNKWRCSECGNRWSETSQRSNSKL